MTIRQHLVAAAQSDAQALADLHGPPMPAGLDHAWHVFHAIQRTRQKSSAGAQRITHVELQAYQHNMRDRLTPLEVVCILEADDALMAEVESQSPSDKQDGGEELNGDEG